LECFHILPSFIRHYGGFADEIHIFDDGSTDGSAGYAESHGCDVQRYGAGGCDETKLRDLKNSCWKSLRGVRNSWAIVVDVDEFIHFDRHVGIHDPITFREYLDSLIHSSFTVIHTIGYQMVSDWLPDQNIDITDQQEMRYGYADHLYSKPAIFRADLISEMNYSLGAHFTHGVTGLYGSYVCPDIKLLHYRFIGGPHFLNARQEAYHSRAAANIKKGWKDYGEHFTEGQWGELWSRGERVIR